MFVVSRGTTTSRLYPSSIQFAKRQLGLGGVGGGAGNDGGGAGAIRAAGGSFGKLEAAYEQEYFNRKQREQLERLRNDQIHHAEFHRQQIKVLEEEIQRHKLYLDNIGNYQLPASI